MPIGDIALAGESFIIGVEICEKGECGQILHLCCVLAHGMDTWVCQHQALVQLKHSACTEHRAQRGCARTCA